MRFAWSALLVVAVFAGVGMLVDHLVLTRVGREAAPPAQMRLAAAMAGLFAGGAVASVTALALVFRRRT